MTTKEKLKAMLTECGMFETQAEAVLEIAIPQIEALTPEYHITWDRPAQEYPEQIYTAMWLTLKAVAKDWIAKNEPRAWYRPMFES